MIPTDSADVREQQERDAASIDEQLRLDQLHRVMCDDQWLGDDARGRPIPCPVCRPDTWPCACVLCAMPAGPCERLQARRGRRCCDACQHPPMPTVETAVALRLEQAVRRG